jgi:YVTN family beta-propeller protein
MAGPKSPKLAAAGLLMLAVVCGCGSTYRPVVTPINPTGPPPQPTVAIAVVSQQNAPGQIPLPTTVGVATIVDFAGDSIMAQGYLGPGPTALAMAQSGSTAYSINSDHTLSTFPVSAASGQAPLSPRVLTTTLLPTSNPVNVLSTSSVFLADSANNEIDFLSGNPAALKQAIPVSLGPVGIIGNSVGQRVYAITQQLPPNTCDIPTQGVNGEIDSIETSTNSVSNKIPVGVCPVYGIQSTDTRRVFILNRGSGTVTVIDGQANQLNSQTYGVNQLPCNTVDHPFNCQTFTVGGGPVYAEMYQLASILVTANYDSNTVSFIDVSTDVYGNNSSNFGHVLATVAVGKHPSSVTVLQDGSRAYTANQGDGTVSVIDMSSFTVKRVISIPADATSTTGVSTPRSVASITNGLYSKVYVTSPDSPRVTIIRTDTDSISATIQLPGNVVGLRTASQITGGANTINASNSIGSGTP